MANPILDTAPYPFHLAVARELHLTFCQLYPTSRAAQFVAQKAGVPVHLIFWDQAPYLLWSEILGHSATAGLLRALAQVAVTDFPNGPSRPFLAALLADREPVVQREPRAADGTPNFVRGSDDVTEKEALLFQDDLTLPAGRLEWLIEALNRLRVLKAAVCRLEVSYVKGTGCGTGFCIGPDLLLTNWHVVCPEGEPATAITATFGYEDDGKGQGLAGTAVPCDVASIKSHAPDDWAVIRTSTPLSAAIPVISLLTGTAEPVANESAFIIQHPQGARKRVGYTRNRVTLVDERVVQYLTDTEEGASGSPVFNHAGRVIGLHHAGGRPIEVAGRIPVKKNEGIRIERVRDGILAAGVAL